MRCYGCGSGDGNESTLCPQCNAERQKSRFSTKEHLQKSYKLSRKTIIEIFGDTALRVLVSVALLIGFSGIYKYFDSDWIPFTRSSEEQILRSCLDGAASALQSFMKGEAYQAKEGDPLFVNGPLRLFIVQHLGPQLGEVKYQSLLKGDGSVCSEIHQMCSDTSSRVDCSSLVS